MILVSVFVRDELRDTTRRTEHCVRPRRSQDIYIFLVTRGKSFSVTDLFFLSSHQNISSVQEKGHQNSAQSQG